MAKENFAMIKYFIISRAVTVDVLINALMS